MVEAVALMQTGFTGSEWKSFVRCSRVDAVAFFPILLQRSTG